ALLPRGGDRQVVARRSGGSPASLRTLNNRRLRLSEAWPRCERPARISKEWIMTLTQRLLPRFLRPRTSDAPKPADAGELLRCRHLMEDLSTAAYVALAYEIVLGRTADLPGYRSFVVQIEKGELSRQQFLTRLVTSTEFQQQRMPKDFWDVLHGSR